MAPRYLYDPRDPKRSRLILKPQFDLLGRTLLFHITIPAKAGIQLLILTSNKTAYCVSLRLAHSIAVRLPALHSPQHLRLGWRRMKRPLRRNRRFCSCPHLRLCNQKTSTYLPTYLPTTSAIVLAAPSSCSLVMTSGGARRIVNPCVSFARIPRFMSSSENGCAFS